MDSVQIGNPYLGFHETSYIITLLAAVKFKPTPVVKVNISKRN